MIHRLRPIIIVCLVFACIQAASASDTTAVEPKSPETAKKSTSAFFEQVKKATDGFKDISATVVVEYKNDEVMAKIDKKYAQQYELKKAQVRFKAPDKTRLEGSLGVLKFTYITNNYYSIVKIKPIGYEKREPIADRPHKRQGSVDLGLITKDMWSDYTVEEKGTEGEGADACNILHLTRGDENHSNLHRIWVNKTNYSLVKMEKYGSDKKTMKLFYKYSEPKQINGIWVPTKIEMFTPEGELAGATRIQDIKVNTGLEDSLFK